MASRVRYSEITCLILLFPVASTEVLQGHLLDLWAGLQGAGPLFLYVWLLGLGWTCQSPFWCSGTWPQGSRAFYTKA